MIAAAGSRLELIGETTFTRNQAQLNGGAITSPLPSSVSSYTFSSEKSSVVVIERGTSFIYNKCGSSGGAIAMSELLSVSTMDRAVITFLGNSASINGGAVYIPAIEVGAVFYGALFESNRAESGGGVYAVASGHAVSTDSNTGDTVEHPTTTRRTFSAERFAVILARTSSTTRLLLEMLRSVAGRYSSPARRTSGVVYSRVMWGLPMEGRRCTTILF